MSEYISIRKLRDEFGIKSKSGKLRDQIQREFPGLIQRVRIDNMGHVVYSVPVSEIGHIAKVLGYSTNGVQPSTYKWGLSNAAISWEHKCAQELEAQGYMTVVTKEKGVPDVIAFRKRESGGFDLIFREVKGPGDGVRKEQLEFQRKMSSVGVDADFVWFEA